MLLYALLALLIVIAALVLFTGWIARRAAAAVPPIGRFIDVDGLRLHYLDEGSGPVLLMIHGLASQLQSFTYALTPLLRGRYRLLLLDRPGNGYSQAGPSAGLAAHAKVIADFLETLRIEKALVVGHSLGGAVALALAIDRPDLVAGLALLAPATQAQDAPPEALSGLAIRSDLMRHIIGWTVAVPIAMAYQRKTLLALFAPDPVAPDFGTRGGGLLPLRPWAFRHASRDLIGAGADLDAYTGRQASLTMPIGVLYGTGDQILDYRIHGEGLAKIVPGIDLELIHAGHMIPLAQPEATAAFIDRMAVKAGLHV